MFKNSKKIVYIFLAFLVLTSFSFLHYYSNNSNNSVCKIDELGTYPDTNEKILNPFTVGVASGPTTIDPVDCWDRNSLNIIEQVCEGLFKYNLTDPSMPRLNWLAESYWWEDETTLRLKLREGIIYHDGAPFNSNAAKWNLDRINYLTNATGTLPDTMTPAAPSSLWKFNNGTSIMNQIDYVNEYNITIHLNGPYSPFLDLLCMASAQMISPSSHSQTDYIDLSTGDLVGTGPFEYDNYNSGIEVNFHAFDTYWRGEANITQMNYQIIGDLYARNNAMLNGVIDYLVNPSDLYYSAFAADPDIVFTEVPTSGLVYYYIGMNNAKINVTWRKSISYAINYSYIIQEMRNNQAVRAYSPIAPGFGHAYYNCSSIAPYYNLTIARQILIDDPLIDTSGLTANDNPNDVAWEAANLGTFKYTYYGTGFWAELYPVLVDWCDNIGITILDDLVSYFEFWDIVQNSKNTLDIFSSGWGPDYFEAFTMINPLFSNTSVNNWASVNDPSLEMYLADVIETTDDSARNTIYHDIQIQLSSDLYPHAFLFHNRLFFVHDVNLLHFPYNSLQTLDFYSCEWIPKYTYTPPTVGIILPTINQGFADIAPFYSLTVSSDSVAIWYTFDNGVTNTLCGLSGQIDLTIWNSLGDGTYTLRFYTNNSAGLISPAAAVSIYKDTTDPVISINSPNPNQEFIGTIPNFDITVTEPHLVSVWYTLDNGLTTIPVTANTGPINTAEWNALPYGEVNITFYAIDSLGNFGSSSVLVYKKPQGIPGPFPILILALIVVGIIGFTLKRKKEIKTK
ncbi:MAG: ABC transporter substrate-binding protein [Promethearchaeota archaeon]